MALIGGVAAYTYIVGSYSFATPVQARPAYMPANPHILYLAPQGAVRGLFNDNAAQNRGAQVIRDWQSARSAAANQPLDALLIDASFLNGANPSDLAWLRSQFHDGVVMVGLGTEDALFAKSLGVSSLRSIGESDIPITAAEYRLVYSQVVGEPEDIKTMESSNWIERIIRGEGANNTATKIKYPLMGSFSKSRGRLDSEQELDLLFFGIKSSIQDAYQRRAEIQELLKKSKAK